MYVACIAKFARAGPGIGVYKDSHNVLCARRFVSVYEIFVKLKVFASYLNRYVFCAK